MNKLIITADDFGMCESVNEAILDCIKARIVLSTRSLSENSNFFSNNEELGKKVFSDSLLEESLPDFSLFYNNLFPFFRGMGEQGV